MPENETLLNAYVTGNTIECEEISEEDSKNVGFKTPQTLPTLLSKSILTSLGEVYGALLTNISPHTYMEHY